MGNVMKDIIELAQNLKSSKQFRLLKDLPNAKAGTIFEQYNGDKMFIVPKSLNDNGGIVYRHLFFNLYSVEDDYAEFFEPIPENERI